MRKVLVFAVIVLMLTSCTTIVFDNYPGVKQEAFPAEMQGFYFIKMPIRWFSGNADIEDTVTVVIENKGYGMFDSTNTLRITNLDDKHILTLVRQKYYVQAVEDENYRPYWNINLIMVTKKGLMIYPLLVDTKSAIETSYFKKKLLEVKQNGDSVFVFKMDEDQFIKYIEKEIMTKEAIRLQRIK